MPPHLNPAQLYINRELSWLEFNQRVLDQARDPSNPLLERLKFLCIVSTNLDEFFEIRVAGLKQQRQTHTDEKGPDGLLPAEVLMKIAQRVRKLVDAQYQCWREQIQPALAKQQIIFHHYPDVPEEDQRYFEQFFNSTIYPVLTPLAMDPTHPFPQLLNKSLNVMVELEKEEEAFPGIAELAVVQVPRILPRLVRLASREPADHYIFLGNIIQHHVGNLFKGMRVRGAYLFRVTRNSNLYFDEEEVQNLLHAIESELRKVNRGAAVRLEVQKDCPQSIVDRLLQLFNLEEEDVFRVDGPLNLLRLMPLALQIDRPDLRYRRFSGNPVVTLESDADMFCHLRRSDILLHHPYDSFQTVVNFLAQAAEDPHVLAIKQTLYRTSADSPIVQSLIEAAHRGKQVTVVIELKARFDEAANIKWARQMREAGVDVVYGIPALKTHAKAMLIVRDDGDVIRRYAHLGTGNYHPATARVYTDLGLLTCREEVTTDLAELFNLLTGVSKFQGMKELLVAPFNLHATFLEKIERETQNALQGLPAGIDVKLNALIEEGIIEALYRASQAGVPIRLLVRGMCALRPGIPQVSDRIEVRSIVGRFLEHSRIFRFENAGHSQIYLGSADWMPRNLFRRVEMVFPITFPPMKAHVEEILAWQWKDNVKARRMRSDGTYPRMAQQGQAFDAQAAFLEDAQQRKNKRKQQLSEGG